MIAMQTFGGMIPKRSARLLPGTTGQQALNTYLARGTLAPIRRETLVHTFGSPVETMVLHQGTWLGLEESADAVPGPVADDRLYLTAGSNGTPQVFVGGEVRPLKLLAPTVPPAVTPGPDTDPDTKEATGFAFTVVTDLGEESAPSPLSTLLEVSPDQTVTLSGITLPEQPTRGVTGVRIYRSQTSAAGVTDLYFITQIAPGANLDTNTTLHPLQEPIATSDYDTPDDDLEGLTSLSNGMMAAFKGREIFFCEPFIPHAWPVKYALKVDYPIKALVGMGNTVMVLTEGYPYRIQGTHPESMLQDRIEENLPCLSGSGAVDVGYGVAYPSNEGLVVASAQGSNLVSRELFTREQWDALDPASFRAGLYNGRYVFSYATGGTRKMGSIDLRGDVPFYEEYDLIAQNLHYDLASGDLFVLIGSAAVYRFHDPAGTPDVFEWKSRIYSFPYPVNFGVLRAEGTLAAAAPILSIEVYADGVLKKTISQMNVTKRLPSGFKAQEWEIRVTSNCEIERLFLAQTFDELKGLAFQNG